jgi:hypothetical protein
MVTIDHRVEVEVGANGCASASPSRPPPRRRRRAPGALYLQQLRFPTLPSAQAIQQPVEAHLRPTNTKQVLRAEKTRDGDATRGETPNPKGGLQVQL